MSDMARLKTRTICYIKDALNCWSKSGADFECKVECPYNELKAECDCHTAVCKDALEYINELEAKLADVVPKSEVEELIKSIDDMLDLACAMTGLKLTYYGKYAELKKKYLEDKNV